MNPIGCWNVRGANDPSKHIEIRKFVLDNRVNCFALVETKLKARKVDELVNKLWPGWGYFHNGRDNSRARILVIWNPSLVQLKIEEHSNQFIHTSIEFQQTNAINVTFVYGDNLAQRRKSLWEGLESIALSTLIPWAVIGDFNAIRYNSDRAGGSTTWPSYMDDLNICIQEAGLEDVKASGLHFTWQNNNEAVFIRRKLDRVLINDKWMESYTYSEAKFLSHSTSDHTPMILHIGTNQPKGGKTFRFFNHWTQIPGFWPIIEEAWGLSFEGNKMASVVARLQLIKKQLKEWYAIKRNEMDGLCNSIRNQIERLQTEIDVNGLRAGDLARLSQLKFEAVKLTNLEEQSA